MCKSLSYDLQKDLLTRSLKVKLCWMLYPGDCWFVAAAATLACHPDLFKVVVPDDQSFTENYAGNFVQFIVAYFPRFVLGNNVPLIQLMIR